MVRSMTGFGSASVPTTAGRFAVEIRSVNHRFSEIVVRLPRDLAPLEEQVRAAVQGRVLRGRVEVSVVREDRGVRARTIRPDTEAAAAYAQALKDVAGALGMSGDITLAQVAAFPDVIKVEEPKEEVDRLWPQLQPAVESAVDALTALRDAEGRRLAADLLARLGRIRDLTEVVAARSPAAVSDYAARLRARVGELLGDVPVDEQRLAAEIVIFAERSDVTEELTRLRSHAEQFALDLAATDGALGRKLEFLLQEMGREANTIGAKANDMEISRTIIAVKGELESLREQVQNIE
ncbi:MAG TPA: YicC/YloC family endoribonuclease [bacterium]|nr:YicC/YloC family endoribonuclease [bacterium]